MNILFTAAAEDAEKPVEFLQGKGFEVLHIPLMKYELLEEDDYVKDTFEGFESYQNIIYGSKRNASFFWEQVVKYGKEDEVRSKVNFVVDRDTQTFLEGVGVAAILPRPKSKGIDVLEFMIRFNRLGTTLYPAGEATQEEMPGLLEELGVAHNDLNVFRERNLTEAELADTRIDIQGKNWDTVIFHSRSSVNRFFAACPDFDLTGKKVFVTNEKVAARLNDFSGIDSIDIEGNWESIK